MAAHTTMTFCGDRKCALLLYAVLLGVHQHMMKITATSSAKALFVGRFSLCTRADYSELRVMPQPKTAAKRRQAFDKFAGARRARERPSARQRAKLKRPTPMAEPRSS